MKICRKCNNEKEVSLFNKKKTSKDGLNSSCKECCKKYSQSYYSNNKEDFKRYYMENSESIKENTKNYRLINKEYYKEYHKEYYKENKSDLLEYKHNYYIENRDDILNNKKEYYISNIEYYLQKSKVWRLNNRQRYLNNLTNWRLNNKEYQKEWLLHNPFKTKDYYLTLRLNKPHIIAWRAVLNSAIRRLNTKKSNSTIELLGYSSDDIKNHMESLFIEDMTWDNWGEWHIDHKIPVSKYDSETPMNIVNSLNNLQPLWAFDNLSKGNKII